MEFLKGFRKKTEAEQSQPFAALIKQERKADLLEHERKALPQSPVFKERIIAFVAIAVVARRVRRSKSQINEQRDLDILKR